MDSDAILSISTSSRRVQPSVAQPSAVLDLIYACYYLRGLRSSGRTPLPWAAELLERAPQLAARVGELVTEDGNGSALFAMALELGYADDPHPMRFLNDAPDLPRLLKAAYEANSATTHDDMHTPSWIENPPSHSWAGKAAALLDELWQELRKVWEAEGQPAAEAAAVAVEAALNEGGDVMQALPRRHFAQFESLAASLREAHGSGRLRIVPLALAESGGFHLDGNRITAVGFGLHGEQLYKAIEGQVAEAAEGAKAVADPTRLMLLNLIVRYERMSLTVGDLARQVGVSQPTVSGHLKLLREAGLIRSEREGNKTLPKPNAAAIAALLSALHKVLKSDDLISD